MRNIGLKQTNVALKCSVFSKHSKFFITNYDFVRTLLISKIGWESLSFWKVASVAKKRIRKRVVTNLARFYVTMHGKFWSKIRLIWSNVRLIFSNFNDYWPILSKTYPMVYRICTDYDSIENFNQTVLPENEINNFSKKWVILLRDQLYFYQK